MAGFGFSPSDIVEFGKFTAKILQALKEEGGARTEYQFQVHSCQSLQKALKEIENLNLSHVTDGFAHQLEQRTLDTTKLVADFRKTIAKYDKALGKDARKGYLRGAGRKNSFLKQQRTSGVSKGNSISWAKA